MMNQTKKITSILNTAASRWALAAAAMVTTMALTGNVVADYSGEEVVVGDVTFTRNGNTWTITASDGSVINYDSFNIWEWETFEFLLPDEQSRILNRVTGDVFSQIDGNLFSNGMVYLINPAGVYFGDGAVVNVGGLFAAAANMTNDDFVAGHNLFTGTMGEVVNSGQIYGGSVHLIGQYVRNHGLIATDGGVVTMVAGNEVMIQQIGDTLMVQVDGQEITNQATPHGGGTAPTVDAEAGVVNTGVVTAGDGSVVIGAGDLYSLAVDNVGVIEALGGSALLASTDGTILNRGSIDAGSGSVTLQGPSVVNAGDVHADGDGGTVNVSAGNHAFLMPGSVTSASGDNGSVTIKANDGLALVAKGATIDASGANGFAEVSGNGLVLAGNVELGGQGTLLIDPEDLFVVAETGNDDLMSDGVIDFEASIGTTEVAASTLTQLSGGIILQANRDIGIQEDLHFTNNNDFELQSGRHISIDADVTGAGNVTLSADHDLTGIGGPASDGEGSIFQNEGTLIEGSGDFWAGGDDYWLGGNTTQQFLGGDATFAADVVLAADGAEIRTGTVTYEQQILTDGTGNYNYTISAGTGIVFEGNIGGNGTTEALNQLVAVASTGNITFQGTANNVLTVGQQIFAATSGDIVLGTDVLFDSGGTQIAFTGNIEGSADGVGSITVTDGGAVSLANGVVGGTNRLASIDITSSTVSFSNGTGVSVRTTGTQEYDANVLLGNSATLEGSTITFLDTVDSQAGENNALIVTGDVAFEGNVGVTDNLSSLHVTGTTAMDGGDVVTTGTQAYDSGVSLGATTTLTGTTLTFGSTVDSAGNDDLDIAGDAVFSGLVGDTDALGNLHVSGTTSINGGGVTTTGNQDYDGDVSLGATTTLAGTTLTFGSAVDSAGNDDLDIAGDAVFSGLVGDTDALGNLHVSGTTAIDGGGVTTTGTQAYDSGVSLGATTTLTGTTLTFGSTVDSAGNDDLDIAGDAVFSGLVGDTDALGNLHVSGTTAIDGGGVTTTGTQAYDGDVSLGATTTLAGTTLTFGSAVDSAGNDDLDIAGDAVFSGLVGDTDALGNLHVSGTTAIDGGGVTTTGTQAYDSGVSLGATTTLTGTTLTFGSTVDSATHEDLDVAGDAVFAGAVGGTDALGNLHVSGTTAINGGGVTTTGNQDYDGLVTLGATTSFDSTGDGGTGGAMTFGAGIDAATFELQMDGGSTGDITFGGDLTNGGTVSITDGNEMTFLNINAVDVTIADATTSISFNGAVNATGTLDVTSGGTIDAASTLTADVIDLDAGTTLALNDATNSTNQTTLNSGTSTTINANVTAGTDLNITGGDVSVTGNRTLTATAGMLDIDTNVTGDADVSLASGASTMLSGSVHANGELDISGGDVTMDGTAQSLTAGGLLDINVSSVSANDSLVISGAAGTELAGNLSATTNLTISGGDVTTEAAAAQISAGGELGITVANVNADDSLTLSGTGGTSISGDVTAATNLTIDGGTVTMNGAGQSLTASAGALDINVGAVNADNALTLDSATGTTIGGNVTAATDLTLTGADVTMDGAGTQTLTASGGTLDLNVADVTASDSLTISGGAGTTVAGNVTAAADLTIDGGTVTTDGANSMLTATAGTLDINVADVNANDSLTLASGTATTISGNVAATNNATINGGDASFDGTGTQSLTAGGALDVNVANTTASDSLTIDGGSTTLAGNVVATTNLTLDGGNVDLDGGGDQTLEATGGDLDINVAMVQGSNAGSITLHSSPTTTTIAGDVVNNAGDLIITGGNVVLDGAAVDQTLSSTTGNLDIDATLVTKTTEGALTLNSVTGTTIAGNVASDDGNLNLTGGSVDLDGTGDQSLTASDGGAGNATLTAADGVSITKSTSGAATLTADLGMALGGDITTTDGDLTLTINDAAAVIDMNGTGDQLVSAVDGGGGNARLDINNDINKSTAGNLTLNGDEIVSLAGDASTTAGDLNITGGGLDLDGVGDQALSGGGGTLDLDLSIIKTTDGSLDLSGDMGIEAAGDLATTNGDLNVNDTLTLDGTSGDQALTAGNGTLNLNGMADSLLKTTDGNVTLTGDVAVNVAGRIEVGDHSGGDAFHGRLIGAGGDWTSNGEIKVNGIGSPGADITDSSISIVMDGNVNINEKLWATDAGGSVFLHAGTDGTGDVNLNGDGAVQVVHGDNIEFRAGDGVGGGGDASAVNYNSAAFDFADNDEVNQVATFTWRQDSAIDMAVDGPAGSSFLGSRPTGVFYTVQSDAGSVTINDASMIGGSNFKVNGTDGVATDVEIAVSIDGTNTLASLDIDGTATVTGGGLIKSTNSIANSDGNGNAVANSTGHQDYRGGSAALLIDVGSLTIEGMDITFHDTVDSVTSFRNLTVNSIDGAGNITFMGEVGGNIALENLTTGPLGTTHIDGGLVNANSDVLFNNAVELGVTADTTVNGRDITFGSTLDSTDSTQGITINSSGGGRTTFQGQVGSGQALANLATNSDGSLHIETDSITTTGDQTYADAVKLATNNVTMTATDGGSTVMFTNSVDADNPGETRSLTVVAENTVFNNQVGQIQALENLSTSGNTTINGGLIITNGTQTYGDAAANAETWNLTLGADTLFQSGGDIAFNTAVDGDGDPAGPWDMHVNAPAQTVTFRGDVGSNNAIDTLLIDASTATVIGNGVAIPGSTVEINTAQWQQYSGTVTLAGDVAITASTGNIDFDSTVDGDGAGAWNASVEATTGTIDFASTVAGTTGFGDLTVTAAGQTTFNDGVGGGAGLLGSLTTNGHAQLASATSDVSTSGDQTYNDTLDLTSNRSLNSTGGAGTITFNDNVDGTGNLSVDATATGQIAINNATVTTVNDQIYTAADMSVGGSVVLTSTAGNLAVNANTEGAGDLTVNVSGGAGTATFNGDIGNVTDLDALTINGHTTLNGSVVETVNDQLYNGTTTLGASNAIATSGGGNVTFIGTVDGSADFAEDLSISTGAGDIDFQSAVGSNVNLGDITIVSANNVDFDSTLDADSVTQLAGDGTTTFRGDVTLNAAGGVGIDLTGTNVTFEGVQVTTANGGTVDMTHSGLLSMHNDANFTLDGSFNEDGGGTTSTGADITTTDDDVTFNSATTLTETITLTAGGGAVTFNNTLDSATMAEGLTSDAATTTFNFAVGNGSALDFVTTTGDTNINGGIVTTVGAQTYGDDAAADATVINANTTLTAGSVTFGSTLDGSADFAEDLEITTGAGDIDFQGAVGSTNDLGDITIVSANNVDFDSTLDADSVTQLAGDGTTTFRGDVTLNAAGGVGIDLTGTNVTFEGVQVTTANGGTVDMTHSGLLSMHNDANFTLDGSFNEDGGGTTSTGADITTTDDDVTFNSATTLTDAAGMSIDTGAAGGGNVTFTNTLDDSADFDEDLTITAGTGNVDFQGAVGAGTDLGDILVNSATDVDFDDTLDADSVTQLVGDGTTTFRGDVTLNAAGGVGIDLTGTNVTFEGVQVTTANGGTVDMTHSGLLSMHNDANFTLDGSFNEDGGGTTSTGADITTTDDDVTFNSATTLTDAAGMSIDTGAAGGGNVTFTNTLDGSADFDEDLTITAGTGNVDFQGAVGAGTDLGDILVNSATDVDFDDTLDADSVTQLVGDGTTTFRGDVTLNAAGGVGIDLTGTNVTFEGVQVTTANGGTVDMTHSGLLSMHNDANFTLDGSFNEDGGGTTSTGADITTTDDDVTFQSATTLTDAAGMSIDTGAAGGGNVTFTNTLDGSVDFAQDLTITAGTGNVDFQGAVGAGTDLGDILVNSATDVDFDDTLDADSVTQLAGDGTTTFRGDVTLNAAGGVGIDLTGTNVTFEGVQVTTANGGTVDMTHSGLLSMHNDANFTLDGSFNEDGGGTTSTGADITTTDDDVTFQSATTLTDAAGMSIDTGAAGGGNVTFTNTLDGSVDFAQDLTITAGTGNVDFQGAVGAGTDLGDILVNSATDVDFDDTLDADSVTQLAGDGTTTFRGDVTLNAAGGVGIDLTGTNVTFEGVQVTTANGGTVDMTHSGLLSMHNDANFTLDGSFNEDGGGTTSTGADITTTDDDVTFNSATTLTETITLTAGGGAVTFNNTLDSATMAEGLTSDAATTTFNFAVGNGSALDFVTTTGDTNINGGIVTTVGIQTYGDDASLDAVTINGDTTLTAGSIDFNSTVNEGGAGFPSDELTIFATVTTFNGDVGMGNGLGELDVTGDVVANAAEIVAIDAVSIDGSVTFATAADQRVASIFGDVSVTGDVAKTNTGSLTILATNAVTLDGNVSTADGNLLIQANQSDISLGGNVTTTGGDIEIKAVEADIILTDSTTPDQSISADGNVTMTAGGTGIAKALGLLDIDAGGSVDINADAMSAAGGAIEINSGVGTSFDGSADATGHILIEGGDLVLDGAGDQSFTSDTLNLDIANVTKATGDLTIQTDNGTDVAGNVAVSAGSIDVTGDIAFAGGTITAGVDQDYHDAVTMATDVAMNAGGDVTFDTTVDGPGGLAIDAANTTFSGAVGSIDALAALSTTGNTNIFGSSVDTVGLQTYGDGTSPLAATDAVVIGGDTVLTGENITFNSTVDEDTTGGLLRATLTTNATTTTFNGDVGTAALGALIVNGDTANNASQILTFDDQTYNGNVALGGGTDQDMASIFESITVTGDFGKFGAGDVSVLALDSLNFGGNVTTEAGHLSLTATTGNINLTNDGNAQAITVEGNLSMAANNGSGLVSKTDGDLTVIASGSIGVLASSIEALSGGNLSIGSGTGTDLSGDAFGSGNLDIAVGDITLSGAGTQTLSGGSAMTLDVANIDKAAGDLNLISGTGTTVSGNVTVDTGAIDVSGDITFNGDGSTITAGTNQDYHNMVNLGGDTTMTAGGGVTFDSTVDGPAGLTINAATATFDGAVGTASPLTDLTVNATSILNQGDVTTTGGQAWNGSVTVNSVTANFTGSDVAFASTLDGAADVTVDGDADFDATVGGITELLSLHVTGDSAIDLAGGSINTADAQMYDGAVLIESDATMNGASATFGSTIDSGSGGFTGGLTINTSGVTTFGGDIGSNNALDFLTVQAGDPAAAETVGNLIIFDGATSVTTTGDVNLNVAGRESTPLLATIHATDGLAINTGGDFNMGQAEKMSVLGDLTITAGGGVSISDMTTLGLNTINVGTGDIILLGREPYAVLSNDGAVLVDEGLDFVSGEGFSWNKVPIMGGAFPGWPAYFSTDTAQWDFTRNLETFSYRKFGQSITAELMTLQASFDPGNGDPTVPGGAILDLRAQGPVNENVAAAIAGALPREAQMENVSDDTQIDIRQDEALLRDMGLNVRGMTVEELMVSQSYTTMIDDYAPGGDDQPVLVSRLSRVVYEKIAAEYSSLLGDTDARAAVAAAFGRVWNAVKAAGGGSGDDAAVGAAFRDAAMSSDDEARDDFVALASIFDGMSKMGLNGRELRQAQTRMLENNGIVPSGMSNAAMIDALTTSAPEAEESE